MPSMGFEPTVSADERPQTYDVDRAATGIGCENSCSCLNVFSRHQAIPPVNMRLRVISVQQAVHEYCMFGNDSVTNIDFLSLCHCYQTDADLPVLVGKTVLSHLHVIRLQLK